jgi:hypothetical protein
LIFSPSGGKYRLFGEYNIRSNPVILPFSLWVKLHLEIKGIQMII